MKNSKNLRNILIKIDIYSRLNNFLLIFYRMVKTDDETRNYLKSTSFDNWKFEDAELLVLLQQVFVDLDLVTKFSIKMETLQSYLFDIYSNYNDVPYHNFRHAFVVTQMVNNSKIKIFFLNFKNLF